jgi:hypothetical protein
LLGGYGGFGRRIAGRLASAGHEVLVAGRSLAKAQAFCGGKAGHTPLALDRADIAQVLNAERLDVVVDASGPFQLMDYTVPRACIAARVPYCDIADGRDFVSGMCTLDAEAKMAGVAIVSGASSVPALSGAVVRRLVQGLDRVRAVEMAISASNKAAAGHAVAAAILGQIGQPISLWRSGSDTRSYGWQEMRLQDFAVPGKSPVENRLIALVDVPDLELLPERLPGGPAVAFRAGAELAFQNLALWLASWLVRARLIGNLAPFARWLLPLQGLTAKLGSDRSAMIARVFGDRHGRCIERRWTLVAENGVGPEIPALSVPPLVERILAGLETPGARDAGTALALEDYETAFAELAISHAVEEIEAQPPLYRRVMGARFDTLPNSVRAMHEIWRDGGAEGEAEVEGPANRLGRIMARVIGFPPPGRTHVQVGFSERHGVETWTRKFGEHRFTSRFSQAGHRLVERFGPLRFEFDLPSDDSGLTMVMRRWSCLRVPLPMFLAPRSVAREWEDGGRFHFDVPIAFPLVGRVVRYRGWLRPCRHRTARCRNEGRVDGSTCANSSTGTPSRCTSGVDPLRTVV